MSKLEHMLETMPQRGTPADDVELLERADSVWANVGRSQHELLVLLREIGRRAAWRCDGAQDLPHWVSIRYGVSAWKASRWVAAADALASLPRVSEALSSGALGLDQVVELTRFATPETESELLPWARERSSGAIRRRADLERRRERDEVVSAERDRFLRWAYSDDGTRFELEAELPADQGAIVAKALTRLSDVMPQHPDRHEHPYPIEARRADALAMLCSGAIAADPDPDRATLVVHTRLETLLGEPGAPNAEIEDGPVIAPDTVRRLACDARLQVVVEDDAGNPLTLGRLTRTPSAAMVRALRHRDRGCRFPGCGRRRYSNAHHVEWWSKGGRTDLDNLVLLCGFHHRLVHEQGWRLSTHADGTVSWFRPNGERYRVGPAPPVAAPIA